MAVIGLVWLFATATLTYAAGEKLTTPTKAPATVAATPRPILIVPDVRDQAFVFAKGILEDGGFGWRIEGGVQGYATNVVVSQRPAAGTRVQDTGAPTLTLTVRRGNYPQDGRPENTSPYTGTSIALVKSPSAPAKAAARRTPVNRPKVAPKRAGKRIRRAAKPKRKLARSKRAVTRARPPAFVVPGAPREPMNEIPLTVRAQRLSAWLTPSRRPTATNKRYWLYQHAWVVTGAKFGWWHGAAALRVLINVDRRVETQWGLGIRSESVARGALAAVEARAK